MTDNRSVPDSLRDASGDSPAKVPHGARGEQRKRETAPQIGPSNGRAAHGRPGSGPNAARTAHGRPASVPNGGRAAYGQPGSGPNGGRAAHGRPGSGPNGGHMGRGQANFGPGGAPRKSSTAPRSGRAGGGEQSRYAYAAVKRPVRMPEKRRIPWWMKLLWVVIVLVLVVSLGALGLIAFKYWQGQHAYEGVAEEVFEAPADMQGTLLGDISVDWDALRAVNPDVVGWVYIPGTVINYPILQADDNVTYLTRDFHGNEGGSWLPTYGAIFLTAENASDFSDDNSVLQGHHLQNGAMFAFIADELKDQEPFNQHRDVYVLTPQGNYHLNSFSIVLSEPYEPIVETNFATVADMTAYVEDKMKRNLVSPDPEAPAASEITQLFTLSTCDEYSSGAHYVLFCYVVDYVAFDDVSGGEGVLVDPNTESVIDDAVNEQ